MKVWFFAALVATALVCGSQANLEDITDDDLKKLIGAEKYVVALFCKYFTNNLFKSESLAKHESEIEHGAVNLLLQFMYVRFCA